MRARATIVALAVGATAFLAAPPLAAQQDDGTRVCTWGGTPDAPTGTFVISPGLTNIPSATPSDFWASGELGGDCSGTMTWIGHVPAGSTCPLAAFEGRVKGLPGVESFWGKGNLLAPSFLYDKAGNLVGEENAQVVTPNNAAHYVDCTAPEGFTGDWPGSFSSVLVVDPV